TNWVPTNLGSIKGAKDYAEGKAKEVAGLVVVDDKTIRFELEQPQVALIQRFEYGIMPKHILGDVPHDQIPKHPFMDAPTVSSGPYKFVKYQVDQYIEMARWDDWWGNSVFKKPAVEHIFAKQIDAKTVAAQLEAGELEVGGVDLAEVARFQKLPNISVQCVNSLGMVAYWLNQRKDYLKDKRVRQAFDYALDKEGILAAMTEGRGKVIATTIFGPPWAVNPNVKPRPYDPEKAKQLLKDANWDFSRKLVYVSAPGSKLPDLFQQQLQAIGVQVEIKLVNSGEIQPVYDKGDLDAASIGGGEFAIEPDLTSNYFKTGTRWAASWLGYSNPQLDQLLTQGASTSDQKKRAEVYFKAQEILSDELPWILLYQPQQCWGISKKLTAVTPYPMTTMTTVSLLDWKFAQ
ncbi:MAG: ABC transporter substrate-binding protein, partial [Chloroflexi bacterium]|nr:ABC transporter substrate-binding protein [Chloroflexota bacterium]